MHVKAMQSSITRKGLWSVSVGFDAPDICVTIAARFTFCIILFIVIIPVCLSIRTAMQLRAL